MTDEEYKEFYKATFKEYDDPLAYAPCASPSLSHLNSLLPAGTTFRVIRARVSLSVLLFSFLVTCKCFSNTRHALPKLDNQGERILELSYGG